MKKVILIGEIGCGKTTFVQSLKEIDMEYKKTQTMEYYENVIDTPGEYLENRRYYNALIVSSYDCDVIGLVQDSSSKKCSFPPSFASIFAKPVIGIITKIDKESKDLEYATACLKLAGVKEIFKVSAVEKVGIDQFKDYLK
ncbi:EutP/PduV family microcompartment system protein [Clostridium sp. D2Q-11]|uniref:EutP/PduV family microcompartment system protein n=1 Tax=Anaeromonas frigoriresistens TaxID=2683708 RepID=A0A942UYA4_9FIRM|nr:EutP/PduV family microcompartment system protein [Anaeromonas frigoriresistens]